MRFGNEREKELVSTEDPTLSFSFCNAKIPESCSTTPSKMSPTKASQLSAFSKPVFVLEGNES